jgi:phage terminase large subunit
VEEPYYDLQVLDTNNYVCEAGFIHHNSGKSHAAVVRIAIRALQYPNLPFGFVEPTFDLIRLIAYPRFMNLFDEWGVGYKLNRADNIITVENGAQIIFRSADTPDRLVGFEVADAVIDEADTLRPEQAADVWAKMLGRCRHKKPDNTPNTLAAVSTPEGFGWMYETFGKTLKPGYELIRAPTSSNPYLPEGYVAQLEATYSTAQLAAYLDGQFVNLNSGSVYPGYDRRLNHTSITENPGEPLHIGMDFNVTNMSAIIHVVRDNQPRAVNELMKVFDTPEMIRIIQERYRGHRIFVYPDASGSQRKTNNASVSDHALLRAAGFVVCTNTRNPAVKDRVLSMNKSLETREYLINTDRCPMLAESLEKQAYNKNGEPDKGAGFDHPNDAASYFVVYRYPIQSNRPRLALVVGI